MLLNGLVGLRIAHGLAHLLFPFEVQALTKDGLPGCDAKQLKNGACVYSTSTYAQSAVYELAWLIMFHYWQGTPDIRALLFASINIMLAVVDLWSAQGANLDIGTSIEPIIAQNFAIVAVLIAAMNMTGGGSNDLSKKTGDDDDSLVAMGNRLWFFITCFAQFIVGLNAMLDPLEASQITLVSAWTKEQQYILARMIALSGAHTTALALTLLFSPHRGTFIGYVMLCTTQVFSYLIDSTIESRMPESLLFKNALAGHAFFIVLFSLGGFLVLVSWAVSSRRKAAETGGAATATKEVKKQQ